MPSERLNWNKSPHSSAFSFGSFDAFGFLVAVRACGALQGFVSERRAGSECNAGKEEERLVLDLLCSHMCARAGGWRNRSLPGCVRVCCHGTMFPALWAWCLPLVFVCSNPCSYSWLRRSFSGRDMPCITAACSRWEESGGERTRVLA